MKLLWLDFETTGLGPRESDILEVASGVAEFDRPFEVKEWRRECLYNSGPVPRIDPKVLEMHDKSGLWEECRKSQLFVKDIEDMLLGMIDIDTELNNTTTLAGSSVHFDLSFIREKMPRLAKQLHYRVYDVSSIVLFCRSLGMPKPEKSLAHRALEDIQESVELAKKCTDWFMPCGDYFFMREGRG